MKQWLGIDPGANGCMCCISDNGTITFTDFKTASLAGYIAYLESVLVLAFRMIAVEAVSAMPGQGVSSMFSFGQRLGEIEGMLQALTLGYDTVGPELWQKACHIPPKSGKKGTFEVMSRLYPTAELIGSKGGILDGRCDALGIAHYLRITYP